MTINRRLLALFAVIASFGTYIIILLGVLVTFTGSGHGCGQTWPFCHGEIIPGSLTIQGVIEYTHRIQAAGDSFLVFALAIWAWLTYRKDFRIKFFACLSMAFILVQAVLGAITVVYEGTWASDWLLAAHFGISMVAFSSVLLLTVRIFQTDKKQPGGLKKPRGVLTRLQWPVWGLAVFTYIVMYAGALVEQKGAVTGCGPQIPGCTTYIPTFSSLAGIQLIHRYVAGLLWLLLLGFLLLVLLRYRKRRDIWLGAIAAFVLVTLQAISGMFNVLTEGQMISVLIHATLISILFSVIGYLCTEVGWPGQKKRSWPDVPGSLLELAGVSQAILAETDDCVHSDSNLHKV